MGTITRARDSILAMLATAVFATSSIFVQAWSPSPLALVDRRQACFEAAGVMQLLHVLQSPAVDAPRITTSTMPEAEITHKIFMDVRVSRQDGSFYVRDDLPDTFENRVLKTRLTIGLYGKNAPNHVNKFLSYVVGPNDPNDDVENPLPSYGRSTFVSLDQSTGLLSGGNIPSLRVTEVGGGTAIRYGSRILPANLWIDRSDNKIPHSAKGLLTHRQLDVTPTFGITTRECSTLNPTHTVFGQILWTDETLSFFNCLQDLPTYSVERPTSYEDAGGVASSVFNAQREFFRGAAKSIGDTRVDKIYEGKLLRRMEVTQVGML